MTVSTTRSAVPVTIPVGQTASSEAVLLEGVPVAIEAPSNLTATILYIEHRRSEDAPWSRIYVDGADLAVQVAAGKTAPIEAYLLAGVTRVRIVAGTAQTGSDAVIHILTAAY